MEEDCYFSKKKLEDRASGQRTTRWMARHVVSTSFDTCVPRYCSSVSLTSFSLGPALWWIAAARAMPIDCCSCLSMARSRRSLRRWAALSCPLAITSSTGDGGGAVGVGVGVEGGGGWVEGGVTRSLFVNLFYVVPRSRSNVDLEWSVSFSGLQ